MNTALMVRPMAPPVAPFGLRADLLMLTQVLERLDHGHGPDRELDALIYEALGWLVERGLPTRRRIAWRCRSPISSAWQAVPSPTADLAAAAKLVPHRWDWWAGLRGGQPRGWCQARQVRPGRDMPDFFEASRATPERALTVAALHARRSIAMKATGHA
jgi:hypothetical protein